MLLQCLAQELQVAEEALGEVHNPMVEAGGTGGMDREREEEDMEEEDKKYKKEEEEEDSEHEEEDRKCQVCHRAWGA